MSQRRKTIGVILGNANSPHTIETIKGIREAAKEKDVNIMCYVGVHSSYFFKDYFEAQKDEDFDYQVTCVYDYINLSNVDALVVSYGTLAVFLNEKEIATFFKKIKDYPTIVLENRVEGPLTKYVITGNYEGMTQIVKHLTDYHGYTKFAYLSGPKGNTDAMERLKAFMDVLSERKIEYSDKSIAYGDFSERVEKQINQLLDDNPDVEAIICANDKMAQTTYAVLSQRAKLYYRAKALGDAEGMKRYNKHAVGKDITNGHGVAVTGYDNITDAANMDPPLTSVVQNAYSNGYRAVMNALSLSENGDTESVIAAPKTVFRSSCGCAVGVIEDYPVMNEYYCAHPDIYAACITKNFREAILYSDIDDAVSDSIYNELYRFFEDTVSKYLGLTPGGVNSDEMVEDIKHSIIEPYGKYISLNAFSTELFEFIVSITRSDDNRVGKETIIEAYSKLSEYIHSKMYSSALDTVSMYEHRTWFMPLISRDMANYLDSDRRMFESAMKKLNVLDIGNAYLFMLDEPILHRNGYEWSCPDKLKLMAYSANGEIKAYSDDEAPIVNGRHKINEYIKKKFGNSFFASVINLYSGEYQYGVLLAEVEPENVLSLYYASVQISTALKYCEMARKQREMQKQLEKMIDEVEEKNEILRSLSEYDQLTGCLNRRGFLENAIELIRNNPGENATVLFADLDHLKEINDKFGHSEGDFAIEHVATNLKEALPEGAIISRLGGDEFIALMLLKDINTADIIRNITDMFMRFNAMTAKPYYVECSVGTSDFICSDEVKIENIMNLADESLYEAKLRRRKSIKKTITVW